MEEISKEKRRFLQSIGIDVNDLPPEFKKHNHQMGAVLTSEEMNFLEYEGMTGTFIKQFSLKDLVGTDHSSYADKSWIEAFLLSKRGEATVEEYFKNPEYYSIGLKQLDQSNLKHITPIELYESDGKYFIKEGNNRLSLIMMKYLAEISRAQTEDEKAKIDEQYTFFAEVNPIPKDKDVMHMINMLRIQYGKNINVRRTSKSEKEYQYKIEIADKVIQINSKEDLEKFIVDRYKIQEAKTIEELNDHLGNVVSDWIQYDDDKKRILNSMFPNLEQFKEAFIKLRVLNLYEKLYEGIDLNNINYAEIVRKTIEIVEREQNRRIEEQQRIEKEQEEKRRVEAEAESKRKSEQIKKDFAVNLKRDRIQQQAQSIPDSVETTYNELKHEENKFSELATKLGLNYSITKTDDIDIYSGIAQIKSNMQKICEQIQKVDDITKLDKVSDVLQELEGLTQDGIITTQYTQELKEVFEKSFDTKVQEIIKQAKVSKLLNEKEQLENEKISIMGKVFGKGKLKQAQLDNIDLKMKLLMTEPQQEKETYSLEDSISDLYTYLEFEKDMTPEIEEFLMIIKKEPELKKMIDKQSLEKKYAQKTNNIKNAGKLIPVDEKRKTTRQQINILQLQNNDMSRQIQNNRAKTVTRQNSLSTISVNSNSALNKFQNIVNEIKLSTQFDKEDRHNEIEQIH